MTRHWSQIVGDIARPLSIIFTSFAASWGIVVVAYRVNDGNDGALYVAAALAGVGALYIGKAVEVFKSNRAVADVEVAKAVGRDVSDTGELPETEKLPR